MIRFDRIVLGLSSAAVFTAAGLWLATAPKNLEQTAQFSTPGDAIRGEQVFYIGGCASCHAAPGATGDDKLILSGGKTFPSPFGTFKAPNISPDVENGIGGWSSYDLANAMINGVSPAGEHYYPAFPYASYARMEIGDIIDLKAFLDTLPTSTEQNLPHELPFPFQFRRGLGLWKSLYLSGTPEEVASPEYARGQYLVEGAGHCAECHTPRGIFGGLERHKGFEGAPNPEGKGRVPNITPHADGIGSWSIADIAYYLESGFTPDFDSVGGAMADVVENTAKISPEDREAIARYLLSLPKRANAQAATQ